MKIKIESDGTAPNTKVTNAETGEEIENIMNLEVSIDAFNVEAAFLVRNPDLSLHQISSQEIQVGDNPIQYDGGASNTDN